MSHFDILEVTDVLGVSTDELGDIVVDLDVSQDEGIDGARFRQALGVRSNPNPKHDLDAVFARTGNEAEVFFISDADVTEALEKVSALKGDETQLYSTGNKPRAISVTDAEVKLGLGAKDAIACEGDEVDVGTMSIKLVSNVLTVTYTDPFGVGGDYASAVPFKLRGKIKPTNRKSKAE